MYWLAEYSEQLKHKLVSGWVSELGFSLIGVSANLTTGLSASVEPELVSTPLPLHSVIHAAPFSPLRSAPRIADGGILPLGLGPIRFIGPTPFEGYRLDLNYQPSPTPLKAFIDSDRSAQLAQEIFRSFAGTDSNGLSPITLPLSQSDFIPISDASPPSPLPDLKQQSVNTALAQNPRPSLDPPLTLNIDRPSISENGGGAIATVTREGDTTDELVITLSSDDVSEAIAPATVTIAAGEASATFTITAVDDTALDGTQRPMITAAAVGFNPDTATLEITDDEVPAPDLIISVDAISISENGGVSTATVTREGDTTDALVINLSTDDATEAILPATARIAAGATSATFAITAVDDTELDGTQMPTITAAAVGFNPDVTSLQITDDELPAALPISHAYAVSETVIALQVQAGERIRGRQVAYTPLADDFVNKSGWVSRNGDWLGRFVDESSSIIRLRDQFVGSSLDTTWADTPGNYQISSSSDPNYQTSRLPQDIFLKSKITAQAQVGPWDFEWPTEHTIYLELPTPLQPGETYQLTFNGTILEDLSYTHSPETTRSDAVHVSHLGFDPGDPAKVAFLSQWMGDGGGLSYTVGTDFWLVDIATGNKVYQGQVELSKAADEFEDNRGRNYNGTDVYLMDFSDFQTPGDYQVVVDGIGTSYSFAIGEKTWEDAFSVSARGFYHQRSGIALEQPYTDYERPRPFHPDDGVKVYQSTATLMDTNEGLNLKDQNSFTELIAGKTDTIVPDAWGGWFDAGDWDRRIQHVRVSRQLLELAASNPDYFAQLDLNIPESNNGLADVVDEALWGIDFFKRLQTAEGGVRGGIESASTPQGFEASWQESQTVMAYAPDMWSSYLYAGVAARAAHFLKDIDPARAAGYQESAVRAMNWAEAEYQEGLHVRIDNARNLAAAELYRLTGADNWHQLFLDTTVFTDPNVRIFQNPTTRGHEDAAFVYVQTQHGTVDETIQQNAYDALVKEADFEIAAINRTGFRWNKHPWAPLGYGSLGAPDVTTLVRAHQLTQAEKYLEAAVLATQFSAGANPDNLVYTTGLGYEGPNDPLIVDVRATGSDVPPGITVYGPLDMRGRPDHWSLDLFANALSPSPWQWPTAEAFFDAYYYIPATEFTVQQTMAPTAFAWGYLAAVDENLTGLPVIGTSGNDNFVGTNRNDSINGAAGNDVLNGGIGADQLVGGEGDDILIGGYGPDVLTGGAGRDRFIFSGTFGSDQITDFQGNGLDQIDLTHFKVTFPQLRGAHDPTRGECLDRSDGFRRRYNHR
jgi:endoglucanase